jgi:hypothetical protein
MARRISLMVSIVIALASTACSKKPGSGSGPAKREPAPPGMEAPRAEPPRIPDARPAVVPGARAGSAALFFDWSKEAETLVDKAVKLVGQKQYAEALPLINEALGKQPDNLSVLYARAYVQSLAGQADAALKDLETLLYAHYPKYAWKVLTDGDLDGLRKPPYRERLDALVKAAKAETVAAWKNAIPFIAASRRPASGCNRLAGGPEVYGYVPETGKFVAFTYLGDGGALAFLRIDAVKQLVVVAAQSSKPVKGFDNLQVQLIDLTTGERLDTMLATLGPRLKRYVLGTPEPRPGVDPMAVDDDDDSRPLGTPDIDGNHDDRHVDDFHMQQYHMGADLRDHDRLTREAAAKRPDPTSESEMRRKAKLREARLAEAAARRAEEEAEERDGPSYFRVEWLAENRLRVKLGAPGSPGDAEGTGEQRCWVLSTGKATPDQADGGKSCRQTATPPRVIDRLEHQGECVLSAGLPAFKNLTQANARHSLGGRDVTFPCGGLVWTSPDGSKALVKPVPGCPNEAAPGGRKGLWLVEAAGTFTDLSTETETHHVLWYGNDHAVVQMSLGVGVVDAVRKKYLKVTTPAGSIRGLAVPGF